MGNLTLFLILISQAFGNPEEWPSLTYEFKGAYGGKVVYRFNPLKTENAHLKDNSTSTPASDQKAIDTRDIVSFYDAKKNEVRRLYGTLTGLTVKDDGEIEIV